MKLCVVVFVLKSSNKIKWKINFVTFFPLALFFLKNTIAIKYKNADGEIRNENLELYFL